MFLNGANNLGQVIKYKLQWDDIGIKTFFKNPQRIKSRILYGLDFFLKPYFMYVVFTYRRMWR